MKHTCHAIGCAKVCPPKHLMCETCWALVSPDTQQEVYRTVKIRGKRIDETWAPWWRAAHTAIAEVARAQGLDGHLRPGMKDENGDPLPPWSVDRWLAKEMRFADELEGH